MRLLLFCSLLLGCSDSHVNPIGLCKEICKGRIQSFELDPLGDLAKCECREE